MFSFFSYSEEENDDGVVKRFLTIAMYNWVHITYLNRFDHFK